MKCDKKDLLLYAVTDRRWLNGKRLVDQVEEAIQGGVTFVQIREKDLDPEKFLEEAEEITWVWGPSLQQAPRMMPKKWNMRH